MTDRDEPLPDGMLGFGVNPELDINGDVVIRLVLPQSLIEFAMTRENWERLKDTVDTLFKTGTQ